MIYFSFFLKYIEMGVAKLVLYNEIVDYNHILLDSVC